MKVYLVTDLEGVSGVSGFDLRDSVHPQDVEMRRQWSGLWMAEVNAAIEGAVAAGAEDILVVDNHGPGDTLPAQSLAAPARILHGGQRRTWLEDLDDSFAAVLIIGQHAMAGAPGGHLRHTYSRRRLEWVGLHGREIGEIGLIVHIAAESGVPVVFLSGDLAATTEIQACVPGVVTAAVKEGRTKHCCVSTAPLVSQAMIRAGVEDALRQRDQITPQRLEPPIELRLRYHSRSGWRAGARWLRGGKGLGWRGGRELRVRGESVRIAWDRAIGLSR
ncbi:MAG: hypothetical protein HN712_12305 [Gemmatimonadetes bacterium]|nr:hypothetical protein [Gemmatimonadota bacterium]MBT7861093.1 hypothetical protein [Gemmatimonadota bacterium]